MFKLTLALVLAALTSASASASVLPNTTVTKPNTDFIAWSGDTCNGAQGLNVPCDGTCFAFSGRHSFKAGTPGVHCVRFWVGATCSGQHFDFFNQKNQCTNVNTGTGIGSFQCFSGNSC